MKALYFEEHGEREVLQYGDLPNLVNKENHVLIKVEACALNHLDVWIRKGWPGLNLEMPHIGGSDVSGIVVEGKGSWKEGDKVVVDPGISSTEDSWTEKGLDSMSPGYKILGEHISGGCAEYVSVPVENVHKRPESLTASQAAAPLLAGLTAYRMLVTRAKIQKGDNVLVMGSTGFDGDARPGSRSIVCSCLVKEPGGTIVVQLNIVEAIVAKVQGNQSSEGCSEGVAC